MMRLARCAMLLVLLLSSLTACGTRTKAGGPQPGLPTSTPILTPTPTLTPAPAATSAPTLTPAPAPTPTPSPTPTGTPNVSQTGGFTIVFHPDYLKVYADDPAAEPGRLESILNEIQGLPDYTFVLPQPATEEEVEAVHTEEYIQQVKSDGDLLYNTALLSAGGAILAAQTAMAGHPAMAINRPPGHHATASADWGYCYFNNIAIAVKKLLDEKAVQHVLIVDFDYHLGGGTVDIFKDDPRVTYFHVGDGDSDTQIGTLVQFLNQTHGYDILAVSAGFDKAVGEQGNELETRDYNTIGTLLKKAAQGNCAGKRFAVLEGGYNTAVLGENVEAFLDGFK